MDDNAQNVELLTALMQAKGCEVISAADEPVIVEDLLTEMRFSGPPLPHEHGVVSGMSVIIAGQHRPFGVLGAHTRRCRTFTPDDLHSLHGIANNLATAIERKRAEAQLHLQRAGLESAAIAILITDPEGISSSDPVSPWSCTVTGASCASTCR